MFTHSHQGFWSAQTQMSNSQPECDHPSSVVQICSKTGERVWATHSLDAYSPVQCQWFRSAQKLTHKLDACSPILINGSDQLKNERATHKLDVFTHSHQWFWDTWRLKGNSQPGCVFTLVSGSDLLQINDQRETHSLNACSSSSQYFWSSQLLENNSQPAFHSRQWFWSAQTLESNSQPGCKFTLFSSVVLILSKTNSQPESMFTHSHQRCWFGQTLESNSHAGYSPFFVSGYLVKH